jgi:predicted secreted hydrolase
MNRFLRSVLFTFLILILPLFGCSKPGGSASQSTIMKWNTLPSPNANLFERADKTREFSFPLDHGGHPNFQTEWWYYTGNLQSEDGRSFGYQLTFFRRALLPLQELTSRSSDLAVNQIYMAHFTITDAANNQFHPFQRIDRGDGKIAGAITDPYLRVWLKDWQVDQINDNQFHLTAAEDGIQIDLTLENVHGIVLQGDNGLSRKSATTASYYYNMPRLASKGTIRIDKAQYMVNGFSWMDHEFSTSTLASGQVGWDWFALHMDDGRNIMLYMIRKDDGTIDPYSQGSQMTQDQPAIELSSDQFSISSINTWKSPHSGAVYPSSWKLTIPSQKIDVTITPLIKDQELNLSFTYWEGAVTLDGFVNGVHITGSGYVELTGYAKSMSGQF